MTSLRRVRRARLGLVGTLALSAALWAALAGMGTLAAAGWADAALGLSLGVRKWAVPAALAAALATLVIRLVRGREVLDRIRVALYLEELAPALGYSLITAVDPAGAVDIAALDRSVARAYPPGLLAGPLLAAIVRPLATAVVALFALLIVPRPSVERVLHPRNGDLLAAPQNRAGSRLAPIVVRVEPPSYAGRGATSLDDPASVPALVGSALTIRGRGGARAARGPVATLSTGEIASAVIADTWSVALVMPARPEVLRLSDGNRTRLLTLEPVPDRAPTVELRLPAGDTTYALPMGSVALEASASDDLGLGRVWFELLLTSGSGERFTTRSWAAAAALPGGAPAAQIRAVLALDTLRLGPGDVLNVRAVARDRNDVGGPSEGSSDTRTLRIADPDRSRAIPILPASVARLDTTVLSQRMLIIRAETLLVRRPRLSADSFRIQAIRLGERQELLRDRVEALITELTSATDVGFVSETEESKILSVASQAMRNAALELAAAGVSRALPEMRRAQKALDEGRQAGRLYLRGALPRMVVDLERVRLKGTGSAEVVPRRPRPEREDPRRRLLDRLDRLPLSLLSSPAVLADSLTMLRAEALAGAPEAAPLLARALEVIRAGEDPRPPLARVRRALERRTGAAPGLSEWRVSP